MRIQDIKAQRAKTVTEMRAITDAAQEQDRDLNDQEAQRFDALKAGLGKLDAQLERAQVIAEAERSMATDMNQPRLGQDGSFEDACRRFSITRAISAQLTGGKVEAGAELEVSQELARRSGRQPQGILVPHEVFMERRQVTSDSGGGSLYQLTQRPDLFIDRLRASLRVQELGATVLSGLVGDQDIPRLNTSATAYWVAEHGAVTGSDHVFESIGMTPHTVGAEVEYSRRMLINASPAVENLVRGDLARVLATAIDSAAIAGDGNDNKPYGLLYTPIGPVEFGTPDGGAPTWDKVLEIVQTVAIDNALEGKLGWLANPQTVRKMRSTVRVSGTDSRFIMEAANMLADYPLAQSTHVPSTLTKGAGTGLSALFFGNWADLLIGYWGQLDILVNPYHSDVYSKGGVKINALQDCDLVPRHVESFASATDVVTA